MNSCCSVFFQFTVAGVLIYSSSQQVSAREPVSEPLLLSENVESYRDVPVGNRVLQPVQVLRAFTEPYERIDVSSAELGIVDAIHVRLGEKVHQGQLLGELNQGVLHVSKQLAARRASSTARLDAARADLKLKESLYQKLSPLLDSGHANPAEVERAKTEVERASAALQLAIDESEEAKIELARIEAQIRQRQIVSPIDGTVIDIHRRPGEYLPANDPRFATVVDVSRLRSRFFVSTKLARELRQGQPIAVLIGADRATATAVIEFVSPITESESGTVRLDVLIDNEKSQWRSGIVCRLASDSGITRATAVIDSSSAVNSHVEQAK